jgi:predicted ribosomally synthesized peptide with nif11-like leader
MSLQSARDFLERIDSDHALRERLEAAPNLESRWKIIQAAGIDFTREEFEQVVEEMMAQSSQDLTSEDLDEISGGVGWCACKGPQYNYLKL